MNKVINKISAIIRNMNRNEDKKGTNKINKVISIE